MREFLVLVADYSGQEVRAMVPGVTDNDVSRWRRGDWSRLTKAKRRAIMAHIDARKEGGHDYQRDLAAPLDVRERPLTDNGGAAEIIHALGDAEWIRRHAGLLTPCERGDFGYEIARRRKLPPSEMAKIIAWRAELCGDDSPHS